MTVSDRIADRVVTQALQLSRFEADVARRVRRLLKQVEADVLAQLMRRNPVAPRRPTFREKRLIALQRQIERTLRQGYRRVQTAVNADLREVAVLEAEFTPAMINRVVGAQALSVEITPALARSLVGDLLIQGAPSREWWAGQSQTTARRFMQQTRLGMAQGEGIDDIARRIRGTQASGFTDGVMSVGRREAQALVRTSVQTISNDVRQATFQANGDVIRGVQWVSTLDDRTSTICQSLAGALFGLDGNPLPESPFQGPQPPIPAHWNCRSVLISVMRPLNEIADISARKARQLERDIPPRTRASMDGQVAADLTFSDFLKTKSVGFQNNMLGKTRAELWRDGRLPLHKLIDQQARPMNLEQLRQSVRGVTQKAITEARAA